MVNLASPNEHIPEIKQQIQVVKEWSWAAHHSLPFQHIPKLLMIHIVLNAFKMLNFFPMKGGIYDTLSPKTIMYGETLNYKNTWVSKFDKICMMTTRLACNQAIESSYWKMDNDLDVGLLMGYVLYRLLVELEFMDLGTFPHWFRLHPSLRTSW
jgi:hypothetical protein